MKRFKATDKGTTKKVESRVAFPVAHLDMAPFTSAPVLAARCHLGKGALMGAAPGSVLPFSIITFQFAASFKDLCI